MIYDFKSAARFISKELSKRGYTVSEEELLQIMPGLDQELEIAEQLDHLEQKDRQRKEAGEMYHSIRMACEAAGMSWEDTRGWPRYGP